MGAGAGYPASADHRDRRTDVANKIVDRVSRFDMTAGGVQKNPNGIMVDMIKIEQLGGNAFGEFLVNPAENHDRAGFQKFCHHRAGQATRLVLFVIIIFVIIGGRDWAVVGCHSGLR